jgi:aldose 1-epimerase
MSASAAWDSEPKMGEGGEVFGTAADGAAVHRIRIKGGGLSAAILTSGAVLQDLRLEGHDAPLVMAAASS